jgi:phosphoribosyl-AMP cyclohydrolase
VYPFTGEVPSTQCEAEGGSGLVMSTDLISRDEFLSSVVFDSNGLVPAIAQDARTGEVLMLAWMNADSLRQTLESGDLTYWSRSRGKLWRKGETSGHVQRLVEARVDCDGDTLLFKVEQTGPACHTGAPTCFFRKLR